MAPENLSGITLKSEKLKKLKPVLSKWIELVNQFSEIFPGRDGDACYWYTERANVGVLAAAAWKTPGRWVALEEFSTLKKGEVGDDKNGRCDLYLAKKGHEESFAFEAKQAWQGVAAGTEELTVAVAAKMDEAWNDAGKLNKIEANVRVAACFVVPRFRPDKVGDPKNFEYCLKEWVKNIKGNVSFDGMAWVFPRTTRELMSTRELLFPGVCLLLQVRHRSNRRKTQTNKISAKQFAQS